MSHLYDHQRNFIIENPNKTALVWSCGAGKSRAAIEWAKANGTDVLIICPKALKENWKREAERWGFDEQHYVITKEEFKKQFTAGTLPIFSQVIVDEVHNGFLTPQFKSQMSKCLRSYILKNQIPRVLLLSATVYTSSPWNIYSLATLLGHHWNWQEFSWTYFVHVRMGSRMVPVPKKGVEEDMAELTRKIASVVDIHDCMDVPEQLHMDPEYFTLRREQEKAIKDNFDPIHIVRYTKQHEIENGILKGDEHGLVPDQHFPTDKLERIKALVEENKKVAIVCRYNLQIDSIYNELLKWSVDNACPIYIIRGATKDRDKVTIEAEAAGAAIVLIQADCAEGYNLPSFELCIFASMGYSYAKYEQVCGRFLRIDKPSRTTFMYLLTAGDSVDQAVYDAMKRKEDFQIALYRRGV